MGFVLITPEDLIAKHPDSDMTLKELQAIANQPERKCDCGAPIWKYGQTGMCFHCTTGEADNSEDYELIGGV